VTNRACEEIRDKLVDYADGELSEQDSQAVGEHLAECPRCRDLVCSLERSLNLAKTIWLDNLQGSGSASGVRRHLSVGRWARCIGIAAGILITIGGALVLCFLQKPDSRALTYAQIEQQATRCAAAARLLVATQLLAGCEDTESLVERQRQYILSHYPDTPAAAKLRTANPLILGV
jgi:predicted anti-sigma-YlaC factor YlaD